MVYKSMVWQEVLCSSQFSFVYLKAHEGLCLVCLTLHVRGGGGGGGGYMGPHVMEGGLKA